MRTDMIPQLSQKLFYNFFSLLKKIHELFFCDNKSCSFHRKNAGNAIDFFRRSPGHSFLKRKESIRYNPFPSP